MGGVLYDINISKYLQAALAEGSINERMSRVLLKSFSGLRSRHYYRSFIEQLRRLDNDVDVDKFFQDAVDTEDLERYNSIIILDIQIAVHKVLGHAFTEEERKAMRKINACVLLVLNDASIACN
ncbi:MAG: hypothetical protein HZB31_04375 [Nitrospirae bacterium]|nr:hypothetical protein [Nitrospirota bacterium]